MRIHLGAAVLAATMLMGACGSDDGSSPGVGQPEEANHSAAAQSEDIGFGEALAQIRGHHRVALELYEGGDKKGASVHAGHPIAEILDSVQSELQGSSAQLATDLEDVLHEGAQAIADDAKPEELAGIFERTADLTSQAQTGVIGDEGTSSAFTGSVIAALLSTSAHEYEEAVGGKGIRLLAEYQDGYAFVREARAMYDTIAGEVEQAAAEEAEEIEEAFGVLEAALPSAQPPKKLAEVSDVEVAAKLIGHELEETVGAQVATESTPEDIVAEIERLLDEIVETYEAGDADAAAELSAEAYLENYELIEAQVIEQAPEINEELEPLLGADLRKRINEGAPLADIEVMIVRAKELLTEALAVIESGH
ncbi:MAG TPA: hypothetical protein VNC78_11665 [Actinomycetota bacterium]|nr:hypothetical protein [Actinomycetota bacterium]